MFANPEEFTIDTIGALTESPTQLGKEPEMEFVVSSVKSRDIGHGGGKQVRIQGDAK